MTTQATHLFEPALAGDKPVHTQYAALCYRVVKDKPQILLITSRGTKRWIVPKGWPMKDRPPAQAALQEAYEEAGVIGRVADTPLGIFPYVKLRSDGTEMACVGVLYPVRVKLLRAEYPEAGERKRDWFSRKKAAKRVAEPELARIIKDFQPKLIRL